ncbi:DUF4937 domain-containing protein [Thermoflavimicrobium dichotomicum]|uniref:Quinol monooxygenase YgiN n=1 Tax=Thermoflavimicrobium dichotomicum TaxID=46223 RepID=A0A1I3P6U4_9BACL|nr:DUF4937 domain-containing protein [Thermoflavimicrobium dichotomicum]SFJ17274.1 Quinol monooxygenase YgiN [Thermoflavimicrobium dichotomicum]
MLIKWIVCQVPEEQKAAFTEAQTIWSALADVDGFYGQWGGWNVLQSTEACILGLWRDLSSYESFMSNVHDTLFLGSNQAKTYQSISITLSKQILSIPGEEKSIHQALSGRWLHMADCLVKPERVTSFMTAQLTVWNPAMHQAEGMLAGAMGQAIDIPNRYQVFSLWRDEQAHQVYAENVTQLREQVGTDLVTISISGCLVQQEEKWLVLPNI